MEAQILEILLGRKVKNAQGTWHVYDGTDTEISDPGGILLRANPGALLMWPRQTMGENYVMFARRVGRR